ncbi:Ubiquitin carboxyl-terminal hydrolase family protein [Candida parapsilosis]|uniref:USP domain-containing protein n=2 Tax=Candida parapsilosis TaxID=5480 RepID=G8B8J6_CANPC|nr:uncharacterized protein CPAR2_108180 [Candida parapsilosis]KAF6043146.1 Ubiquitin carboxyl-terminal hydrolase family protein [Candida parapsilosis]KAF6049276.1 Ubiquitin carboxyl-terminal hydrolase family protein [Candida parapsilosis]KAF6057127.1 Ubiquitin carboxyl-terminal hydrolase family protein [Candida parapsilosis]KAF6066154.1 Ubiquitin carboxyl-terminal hydrolase family protein [Candida parapsilosis]KAI5906059.1 hypothetical protein K4G60_g5330 [Candida parapsilosis]
MDNLVSQLKQLITNQDITTQTHIHHSQVQLASPIPSLLKYLLPQPFINFWYRRTRQQRNTLLQILVSTALALYILLPSLPGLNNSGNKMFTKRPDKHTTGLINLRNDCFANSSLQAYSSLPSLTEYLNKLITSFNQLVNFIKSHNINIEELIQLRIQHHKSLQNDKFRSSNQKFDIPLHIAMASMIKKLQETQMTSKTISVWTFLHELEKIFNAKISRSQHDAQELTQLINETLENENLKIKSFHKFITLHLHQVVPKGVQPSPHDYTTLEQISVPEFPFDGLILSQMTCLTCHGVSKPTFTPFVMLTLPLPMQPLVKLETLLEENESETIEGYQCIKCRLDKIVANENAYANHHNGEPRQVPPQEEQFLQQINDLDKNPHLCINEDLPQSLEDYIKSYHANGLDISKITSTVSKKSHILKPPKIFGLHLSRSAFDGQSVTRNSCRVEFKDSMTLSIGKEYSERLKHFQSIVQDDEEKLLNKLTSSVLTTDENDMEDEDVQRDDFEEKGPIDEDEEDILTDDGRATENGTTEDDEDDDEDDEDDGDGDDDVASSATSTDSAAQTMTTATTLRTGETPIVAQPSINSAPISEQQTEKLTQHFRKFKFNDNDLYKYRLRAVIKHLGSHTQGHYECYKHKPLFVKDKDGNIFKLSPEIMDLSGNVHCEATPVESAQQDKGGNDTNSTSTSTTNNSSTSSFSLGRKSSMRKSSRSISGGSDKDDDGLRSKFSSLMGRRPSVIQANPKNVEEILQTGLHTPAEILVDDPMKSSNNFEDAFAQHNFKDQHYQQQQQQLPGNHSTLHGHNGHGTNRQHPLSHQINSDEVDTNTNASATSATSEPQRKVKMKKISSLISSPYWRISDGQVSEVSRASVLAEETSAYMLYYERVDRKQIKRSHRH